MSWIQTYTGKIFDVLNPKIEDICIEDIAHSLSMQCRYAGHVKRFYSVAEHSVLISLLCCEENQLWGLLHDATEAYITDIPGPLKKQLSQYQAIEKNIQDCIALKYNLPSEIPKEIKLMDRGILVCERDQLMSPPPQSWNLGEILDIEVDIIGWKPEFAEKTFLKVFNDLRRK